MWIQNTPFQIGECGGYFVRFVPSDASVAYPVRMTVMEERLLAVLSPMWQRIARGSVDLSQYSDEEILNAEIYMADGRRLPAPKVLPEVFIEEQRRRGFRVAERKIREGGLKALEVFEDILSDTMAEDKDRIKAGEWFLTRMLGKESQHLHITHDGPDPRELLIQKLLATRVELPPGKDPDGDVVDAELVEELTLEDLL